MVACQTGQDSAVAATSSSSPPPPPPPPPRPLSLLLGLLPRLSDNGGANRPPQAAGPVPYSVGHAHPRRPAAGARRADPPPRLPSSSPTAGAAAAGAGEAAPRTAPEVRQPPAAARVLALAARAPDPGHPRRQRWDLSRWYLVLDGCPVWRLLRFFGGVDREREAGWAPAARAHRCCRRGRI
jgi:hypothetical protein